MAEMTPQQQNLLRYLVPLLQAKESAQAAVGPSALGTVLDMILPSSQTVEKMSYGDMPFRMPTQSRIPITTDKQYLADLIGVAGALTPAAKPVQRGVQQLVREIQTTAPMGQIAYHGSPYLFKQFDPMKVGTGEGAQAYGVGAGYTAEARPVAESYRLLTTKAEKNAQALASFAMSEGKTKENAIKYLEKDIKRYQENGWPNELYEQLYKDAVDSLKTTKMRPAGYLYKGDIPDEILPNFLNWDQPLSQQSDEVKNVLKRRIVDVQPTDKFDMGGNARLRDNRNGQYDETSISPWILETFDSSGTKTFGLTQKDVDRMFGSKNAKDLTGEQIYARLTQEMGSQQAASDYLNSIGIRGIRYLDQGSRSEGKGTSNFVPFRPEDFKIQEINDIPLEEYIAKGLLSP